MTIKIVKAEEKHIPDIGKLWWEFMIVHQNADPIFMPREGSIPGFEEHLRQNFMKSEEGLALVALDSNRIIGFSTSEIRKPSPVYERENYGTIETVAVTANYRHHGIGEKMVAEIMKWFKLKNITRVELETLARNDMANSFWQKQGFMIFRHRLYREF